MDGNAVYIVLSVLALLGVAAVFFVRRRGGAAGNLTPLAAIAFAFVIAGIVFGDNRAVGYSLLGIGVVIAVADIVVKRRA